MRIFYKIQLTEFF